MADIATHCSRTNGQSFSLALRMNTASRFCDAAVSVSYSTVMNDSVLHSPCLNRIGKRLDTDVRTLNSDVQDEFLTTNALPWKVEEGASPGRTLSHSLKADLDFECTNERDTSKHLDRFCSQNCWAQAVRCVEITTL